MTKLRQFCAAAALAASASGTALADTTANIGIMSDYIFRGFYQAEAAAFGGLDFETDSGFYAGTWGANLKNGLEYDLYAGYAGGSENFQWYAGVTGYYYTDEFDNSYEEFNVGFSSGLFSLDVAVGDYENSIGNMPATIPGIGPVGEDRIADKQSYTYVGATFAPEISPVYYFIGRTDYRNVDVLLSGGGRLSGTGKSGYWYEIGKSFEIMEDLDINVAALFSNDINQGLQTSPRSVQLAQSPSSDARFAVTVTLTKTIRLGD